MAHLQIDVNMATGRSDQGAENEGVAKSGLPVADPPTFNIPVEIREARLTIADGLRLEMEAAKCRRRNTIRMLVYLIILTFLMILMSIITHLEIEDENYFADYLYKIFPTAAAILVCYLIMILLKIKFETGVAKKLKHYRDSVRLPENAALARTGIGLLEDIAETIKDQSKCCIGDCLVSRCSKCYQCLRDCFSILRDYFLILRDCFRNLRDSFSRIISLVNCSTSVSYYVL